MALALGDCLKSLHALIDQNDVQSNKEQIDVIVEDIRSICTQDFSNIGQYTGQQKPTPEYHVKIAGFDERFLPVVELIPFRLTRQLTNIALPLKVKGQMESAMKHVMRALRADSDLLLRTMDVFVKEPHLDWLNFAERQKEDIPEEDSENTWYPKDKINIATRKLKGDHPSFIMMQELESVKTKRNFVYKQMVEVLKGQKGQNVRASLPNQGLTVEQQAAALIDQATDPNILGRTWTG